MKDSLITRVHMCLIRDAQCQDNCKKFCTANTLQIRWKLASNQHDVVLCAWRSLSDRKSDQTQVIVLRINAATFHTQMHLFVNWAIHPSGIARGTHDGKAVCH